MPWAVVLVPLQFASFAHDYFTDYQVRSAFWIDPSNFRDVAGSVLCVSQFTLYADVARGNRPGFTGAAPPDEGRMLVDAVADQLRLAGLEVQTGRFGAHMRVSLVNDGPVTIWLGD